MDPQQILEERIKELTELSMALHPKTPEWYARLCVEKYIREEEPHLLEGVDLPDTSEMMEIIQKEIDKVVVTEVTEEKSSAHSSEDK